MCEPLIYVAFSFSCLDYGHWTVFFSNAVYIFRLLLGKAGVIQCEVEDDSPPPPPKSPDKDAFNISNDEYYIPKNVR